MASDIDSISVGETWRKFGLVLRNSGGPVVSGSVSYYLLCLSGDAARKDKWWSDVDQTWVATETATAMTHKADGSWTVELAASPFHADEVYLEYATESGNLHVAGEGRLLRGQAAIDTGTTAILSAISEISNMIPVVGAGSISWDVIVEAQAGTPLSGVRVWITTDIAGYDVKAGTSLTDDFGHAAFLLDAGTYYMWRDHPLYNFPNPTEITVVAEQHP